MKNQKIVSELRRIAEMHDGVLQAADVVEAARPKTSPLHSSFTWDDTEAAREYRLWQARMLINVTVEYLDSNSSIGPTRVLVSLTPDRAMPGGGYRLMTHVLADSTQRAQLLEDAYQEMERFQQKYAMLKELTEVFAVMKRVGKRKRKAA